MPGLHGCWTEGDDPQGPALQKLRLTKHSMKYKRRNRRMVCHLGLPTALGVWKEVGGSCRLPQEGIEVLERRVFKVTGPAVVLCGPLTLGELRGHSGQCLS